MTRIAAKADEISGHNWRDDAIWRARLEDDRARAVRNQTAAQRHATSTVLQRARELGAVGFALTGSTSRGHRTPISDLDIHIVGERPRFEDLNESLDLYASSAETFWTRLHNGDDFIQWTLRFGCILMDRGIFRGGLIHVSESALWPEPERKRTRAEELLAFAQRILATGDLEAAHEQVRAALTAVARWLLLSNGEFPLSRGELPDQILDLGCFDLAAALARLIHAEPHTDELATGIEIGRLVISLPPNRARRAALIR